MTDTITTRSSYDRCVKAIDEAVREVLADQPDAELSEDEVWADMAASLLLDAKESTAREVCRVQLGYVPRALEQVWALRASERKESALRRGRERQRALTLAKHEAARAAQRLAQEAERARMCPQCFTLRTPAGACNC